MVVKVVVVVGRKGGGGFWRTGRVENGLDPGRLDLCEAARLDDQLDLCRRCEADVVPSRVGGLEGLDALVGLDVGRVLRQDRSDQRVEDVALLSLAVGVCGRPGKAATLALSGGPAWEA